MLLAERHIIKKEHPFWTEIDNLSWQSKNLDNISFVKTLFMATDN